MVLTKPFKICITLTVIVLIGITVTLTLFISDIYGNGSRKLSISIEPEAWVSILSSTGISFKGIEATLPIKMESGYNLPLDFGLTMDLFYPGTNNGVDGIKFSEGTADINVPARGTSTELVDVLALPLGVMTLLSMATSLATECGGCLRVSPPSDCTDNATLWVVVTPTIFESIIIPDIQRELQVSCVSFIS